MIKINLTLNKARRLGLLGKQVGGDAVDAIIINFHTEESSFSLTENHWLITVLQMVASLRSARTHTFLTHDSREYVIQERRSADEEI